jgi:tRNA1Val (adenine37-N6)-methyltransferase
MRRPSNRGSFFIYRREDMILREEERIDDLGIRNYKIIQDSNGFCFGMDAVLLANYVKAKRGAKVVDLGTGTGIIPLIINGKNDVEKIYGIEIQAEVSEMAKRSVELNGLSEKIEIVNMDLKEAPEKLGVNIYDVVTSNPPYMAVGEGLINESDKKKISRHEIKCNIDDICRVASRLLKHHGKFFLVHRPSRLVDILISLRAHKLEPKKMRFIHPKVSEKPNLVLIEAVKSSNPELLMEKPLYVYEDDGRYTEEIHEIYGLEKERVER